MVTGASTGIGHELAIICAKEGFDLPGATETEFFERAGMEDTKVGQSAKDDPVDVAKVGFEAMMKGEGDVVSGFKNKVMSTVASVTPSGVLAQQHGKKAEPGSGRKD